MLSSGIKILLEISKNDIRAEVVINAFGAVVNIGIDLKCWRVNVFKKNYSFKIIAGPLYFYVLSINKMNNFFNNFLKDKTTSDYTEM